MVGDRHADGGDKRKLAFDVVEPPVWSPDGERIGWISPGPGLAIDCHTPHS